MARSPKCVPLRATAKVAPPRRRRNAELRPREYLAPAEVDALMAAAGNLGRHRHRNRTLVLMLYRQLRDVPACEISHATHHQDQRRNRGRMVKHLLPRFGHLKLADINTAMVEDLRSELSRDGLARSTIKRIVSLLSGVYVLAGKSDQALVNPTEKLTRLKVQSAEVKPFTPEQTAALMETGVRMMDTVTRGPRKGSKTLNEKRTKEARALVGLALYAGLRASEALGLTWEHVDFDKSQIRITQTAHEGELCPMTKSYKERNVPISPSLRPVLLALQAHHESEGRTSGLLLSPDGKKPYYHVQNVFNRVRKQAGIKGAGGYHALRHTFATRAAEKGINLAALQNLLGHSSITVTMGYVHCTEEHMALVAEKLV